MSSRCECINLEWDSQWCPLWLDCTWHMGYTQYTRIIRAEDGTITGYMNVLEKTHEAT